MDNRAKVLPFPQTSKTGKLPKRQNNKDVRTREYLTEQEVDMLMDAARKTGRHGHRDFTLILMAYRHGLRVSELVSLRSNIFARISKLNYSEKFHQYALFMDMTHLHAQILILLYDY